MEPNNHNNRGRIYTGLFVIGAGLLLLLDKMGAPLPSWLFSWPVALLAIGLFISLRHNFMNAGGWILMTVGALNLVDDFYPGLHFQPFIGPIIIILIGTAIIFRPRKDSCRNRRKWRDRYNLETADNASFPQDEKKNEEDFIDSVSAFSGVKKVILSKNFKGGDITCFMGGAEINLSQADIKDRAVLEVTQVFGGTKLIVPANWHIQSEILAMFSGVEDKRPLQAGNMNPEKVLILKGVSVFGGIDIKSY